MRADLFFASARVRRNALRQLNNNERAVFSTASMPVKNIIMNAQTEQPENQRQIVHLNSGLPVSVINNCRDHNARGRQESRIHAELLRVGIIPLCTYIGYKHPLEAAMNLIDQIDALGEEMGTVGVNGAPRNGTAHRYENGALFCCFQYKKIWVLATLDSEILSLVRKLGLVKSVFVIHTKDTVARMAKDGFIAQSLCDEIAESQFRSFEFVPRVLAYVFTGHRVCCTEAPIETVVGNPPPAVALIDCFGNCKTTVLAEELPRGAEVETAWGSLPYYPQLKSVPDGVGAIVKGSSGLPGKRFAEIVVNGGSAAERFNITVGDRIF